MSVNDPTVEPGDLARLIEVLTKQLELSARALPLLERIAVALERSGPIGALRPERGLADVRLALREARWDEADAIARDLLAGHPDDPSVLALAGERDEAHRVAAAELRDRVEAARQANDADAVLALHDELARVSPPGSLKEFDSALAKWLMALIHRRLRGGVIQAELAGLAGRVSDRFGSTPEGASLKASLPTLRRSVGLCPRCGEPYAGLADACPKCLGAAFEEPPTIELPPTTPLDPADEPENETPPRPFDLNDAQLWQDP